MTVKESKQRGPLATAGTVVAIVATVACMIAAGYSWATDGLIRDVFSPQDGEQQMERLRHLILSFGSFAPFVYTGAVILEVVVAPLPGLMLYAPGGIIFGPLLGGALSLLGNVIGAGIACGVTRSLGENWLSRFFEPDQLDAVQTKIQAKGAFWIFLLRVNPLTSSDIISYAAGFTRIPLTSVMLATGCGLAPLCFLQAWLAGRVMDHFPGLFYPLLLLLVIYTLCVVVGLYRVLKKRKLSS